MEVVPNLSVDGFIRNKAIILTKLFEYFKSSDYSQSNIFYGRVKSMKYILSESSDPATLRDMVTDAFTTMCEGYFESVAVNVTIKEGPSDITIVVDAVCTGNDNRTYTLKETIVSTNNKIVDYDKYQEELYV